MDLSKITSEVSETNGVIDSAIVAFQRLAEIVRNTPANQEALNTLADALDAKARELGTAIDNLPA